MDLRSSNLPDNRWTSHDGRRYAKCFVLGLIILLTPIGKAYGNISLLVEEPYGLFGSVNPTGHSAIYFNHVCAESPTMLRRCGPDEAGVVISRYSKIRTFDWIAIPLLPYLYAVDRAQDVPEWAEAASVDKLRKQYAETHLASLVSATKGYDAKNVWPQLLGVAYIRKIYSFEVATTDEQDDLLISEYNDSANRSHFNLFTNNCADFSRRVINSYYPRAVGRSITADIGITTPKQIAKALVNYSHRHDGLDLNEIIIPQVPGDIPRSHAPRGIVESLLKTKKYVVPIAVLNPYIVAGIAVTYLTNGRFALAKNAPIIPVMDQEQSLVGGKTGEPVVANNESQP
jgi:hypothetical protein